MSQKALDQGWQARLGRWQSFGAAQTKFRKTTEQLDQSFAAMVRDGNVDAAQRQMALYEKAAADAGTPVSALRRMFPKYAEAMAAAKQPADDLTTATRRQTTATRTSTAALREHAAMLLGARGSESNYEQAVDDATKALKDNHRTLAVGTQRGRDNRAALDRIAQSTLDWREAVEKAHGSQARQNRITAEGREQLVRMAVRFGMTQKKAENYADAVLGIPKRHDTDVNAHTGAAKAKLSDFQRYANNRLDGIRDESVSLTVLERVGRSSAASYLARFQGDGYGVGGPARGGDGFGVPVTISGRTPTLDHATSTVRTDVSKMLANLGFLVKKLEGQLGGGALGGSGWRRQWALVHGAFPGASLISAYRPGAVTVTGNRSYHALGRAIDVTPSMAIFNWIRSHYGRNTKELIYSPAGGRQLHNGAPV
jgi:hypothetical protein